MEQVLSEDAIKKRFPESVALVVCKDKKGKVDITPIGWFTLCNSNPRCWAICLYNQHYSHQVISETKEFVLCLPTYSQKKDILYCGDVHGNNIDKLSNCELKTLPSSKINPPLIKDSIACFECKVNKNCDAGDHTIFIGEILESWVSSKKDKVYNLGNKELIEWQIK